MKYHLLFTGLGAGNIGDEAMLEGFLSHFPLSPGSTIEVFDQGFSIVATFPKEYKYIDWKDREACRISALTSDCIILLGGTPIAESHGLDWPMRFHSAEIEYLVRNKKDVQAVGIGVDRLETEEGIDLFRRWHPNLESWTVRSKRCQEALLVLGIQDEKIHIAADLAWLFSPKDEAGQWAESFWRKLGLDFSRPLLGVNVVNEKWTGPTQVKSAIAWALDQIIHETGVQVAFLCNETRPGDYFDAAAVVEICGMMSKESIVVPNYYFTPSQMVALLSFCDITLSQRYHFTIFSIIARAASFSFARAQKMGTLLEELEEEAVGTMETCDAALLKKRLLFGLSNGGEIKNRQQKAAEGLRLRALENFKFLENNPV